MRPICYLMKEGKTSVRGVKVLDMFFSEINFKKYENLFKLLLQNLFFISVMHFLNLYSNVVQKN